MPRPSDLYPIIRNAEGQEIIIDFGARMDLIALSETLQSGEVRSLGITKITIVPGGAPAASGFDHPAQVTLAPGVYKLSSFGGVSAKDGGAPESGPVTFQVLAEETPPG